VLLKHPKVINPFLVRYYHPENLRIRCCYPVSVRFLPSQDAIGGASFSGRVDLVGEDVFGERFANRQIETCEQLGEGFTFSAFQHS
jgi:hypothetical protein